MQFSSMLQQPHSATCNRQVPTQDSVPTAPEPPHQDVQLHPATRGDRHTSSTPQQISTGFVWRQRRSCRSSLTLAALTKLSEPEKIQP